MHTRPLYLSAPCIRCARSFITNRCILLVLKDSGFTVNLAKHTYRLSLSAIGSDFFLLIRSFPGGILNNLGDTIHYAMNIQQQKSGMIVE